MRGSAEPTQHRKGILGQIITFEYTTIEWFALRALTIPLFYVWSKNNFGLEFRFSFKQCLLIQRNNSRFMLSTIRIVIHLLLFNDFSSFNLRIRNTFRPWYFFFLVRFCCACALFLIHFRVYIERTYCLFNFEWSPQRFFFGFIC